MKYLRLSKRKAFFLLNKQELKNINKNFPKCKKLFIDFPPITEGCGVCETQILPYCICKDSISIKQISKKYFLIDTYTTFEIESFDHIEYLLDNLDYLTKKTHLNNFGIVYKGFTKNNTSRYDYKSYKLNKQGTNKIKYGKECVYLNIQPLVN